MRPLRVALALVLAAGAADGRSHSSSHNNCRQGQGFCSQWTNHTVNGESHTPSVITYKAFSSGAHALSELTPQAPGVYMPGYPP